MNKRQILGISVAIILSAWISAQDEIRVECTVEPGVVAQGEVGILKIRIIPRPGIRISAHPELMIKFEESENFSFSKNFLLGSELNFQRLQENEGIFINLQNEIEIPFTINETAFIGKHTIRGELSYTALTQDNWYIKTNVKFSTLFNTKKMLLPKKNGLKRLMESSLPSS